MRYHLNIMIDCEFTPSDHPLCDKPDEMISLIEARMKNNTQHSITQIVDDMLNPSDALRGTITWKATVIRESI